jgi:hypothetical protein
MYGTRFAVIVFAVAAIILAGTSHLFAQTWVSGAGNDANPCSRAAPCKTLAAALSKTAAGGHIGVLDPGDFGPGPVTITQSVTIDGGGMPANISASTSGATGITVSAGASDTVILRGLHIDGAGTGLTGVDFQAGGSLYVEKCTISNLTSFGISYEPSVTNQLFISDTTIENINPGSTTSAGICLSATGKVRATVTIDKTRMEGCGIGLLDKSNGIRALISNSVISGCSFHGIYVLANGQLSAVHCVLANNATAGIAVNASSAATILISDDTIVNSGYGLYYGPSRGSILSTRTNSITQNTNNSGQPSGTVSFQ